MASNPSSRPDRIGMHSLPPIAKGLTRAIQSLAVPPPTMPAQMVQTYRGPRRRSVWLAVGALLLATFFWYEAAQVSISSS